MKHEDIDISGYESPIQVVLGQMRMEQEDGIFRAVQDQGVIVDKDELIKALQYDRRQYDEGFRNGYNAGLNASKWTPVTERPPDEARMYIVACKDVIDVAWYNPFHYSPKFTTQSGVSMEGLVTHWMPLPAPPTEHEAAE